VKAGSEGFGPERHGLSIEMDMLVHFARALSVSVGVCVREKLKNKEKRRRFKTKQRKN
jgi:hypothetical protein